MATTDKAAWLRTVAETHDFGVRLADILRAGDLVLLSGPLGAGKTVLAQGIGAGLGVVGAITSPTFVIARVHRAGRAGRPAMVHVDAYRLGAVRDPRAEVDDLDLDESIDDAVTVVEWGEGVVEQLADAHLTVRIDRHDDEARTVTLEPSGGDWAQRVASLAGATSPAASGARFGAADGYPRSATSAG
jgi:tRNA threonylcarbamoyladenosine biosynthesis protein TsaE